MLKSIFIVTFLLNVVVVTNAQILNSFNLAERNGEVHLRWVISKGNTCNGIDVERSADGQNFVSIFNIEGVCGSTDSATTYSYTDKSPILNATNYYRLKLGAVQYSEIQSVEIIGLNDKGYLIKPHPVVGISKIYFSNENRQMHHITFYDIRGSLIYETDVNSDYVEISNNAMSTGLYFFTIQGPKGNENSSGKLLVSK